MNLYWAIAAITFKEGIRNRALYGIALLALLLLVANLLISGMIMREIGKVSVDMALSTISFSGLLLVLFVGINLIAKDLDKRTIYIVLSRPVSRGQYIFGKFLGMLLLLVSAMLVLSIFANLSVYMVKLNYPNYFDRINWGMILLAELYSLVGLVVLMALSFFFSAITSTSFITLVLTMFCYVAGHALADVKALVEAPEAVGIQVSLATLYVVKAAYYILPNLSFFDLKMHAAHGLAVPLSHIFFTLSYGIVYSALALTAAAFLFRKREFP